jgi:hypothetical protein
VAQILINFSICAGKVEGEDASHNH